MYVGYTFFAVNLDAWYFYLFLHTGKGMRRISQFDTSLSGEETSLWG